MQKFTKQYITFYSIFTTTIISDKNIQTYKKGIVQYSYLLHRCMSQTQRWAVLSAVCLTPFLTSTLSSDFCSFVLYLRIRLLPLQHQQTLSQGAWPSTSTLNRWTWTKTGIHIYINPSKVYPTPNYCTA